MSTVAIDLDGLRAKVGSHLGYSSWHTITQDEVNLFADATNDHQWIHVDPERAKAGPFGTTIAHGYLTLSLATSLLAEILAVEGPRFSVNYGLNRVRFPSPVPVGSNLRAGATLEALDDFEGGAQATLKLTFEVEGAAKPSCVADVVFRYYN
ncbi:MAG TPA: MaoC family dehydratase [Acidimicrobiales bacterium]|nr:MaoC family dehydratase [Acidimicrobiales bacterium]